MHDAKVVTEIEWRTLAHIYFGGNGDYVLADAARVFLSSALKEHDGGVRVGPSHQS